MVLLKLPLPLVLHTKALSVAEAFDNVYVALLAHTLALPPALATAIGLMINVMLLVTDVHGFLGIAVNVNVTLPAVISAGLGVYMACKRPVLLNEPVPDVDHNTALSVAVALLSV